MSHEAAPPVLSMLGDDDPDPRDWLAALIEGSEDAIISKDLSGYIRSWNRGATRLFGYAAEEVIGRPVTLLIPNDRAEEEPRILAEIRNGRRVDHFETVRRRKDGSLVELSLTISPIRNDRGVIVGASKIARDITERREAEERRLLLMGEMQHRVKNLFAVAKAIVSFSARTAKPSQDLIADIEARLFALARAHDLTMANWQDEALSSAPCELVPVIKTILEPYRGADCIRIEGAQALIAGEAVTNLALLMHELATNAAKHGALSAPKGHLDVLITETKGEIRILWVENGGPKPKIGAPAGFGSRLEKSLITALGATIEREWKSTGLTVSITIPKPAPSVDHR